MLLTLCTKMHANHFKRIITARKRSLGQGNVFTPVSHSVHRAGGRAWQGVGMHGRRGMHDRGCAWQGAFVAGDPGVVEGVCGGGVHGRGRACRRDGH